MADQPSLEEVAFQEWKDHPVTRKLYARLRAKRQDLMERWADGNFTTDEHFSSAMKNVEALAVCGELKGLIELEYHQLEED